MAFSEILPTRGRHPLATSKITAAWYVAGTSRRVEPRLRLNIGAAIAREIGWEGPIRVRVEHDPEQGLIRLTKAAGAGWALNWRNGTGAFLCSLPGVESAARPAEECPHRIGPDRASLLVALPGWARGPDATLPAWAGGPRELSDFEPDAAKAPPSPILQAARPDPDAKRAAAEARLKRGERPLRVAEALGLPERQVIEWRNAMVVAQGTPAANANGSAAKWA